MYFRTFSGSYLGSSMVASFSPGIGLQLASTAKSISAYSGSAQYAPCRLVISAWAIALPEKIVPKEEPNIERGAAKTAARLWTEPWAYSELMYGAMAKASFVGIESGLSGE